MTVSPPGAKLASIDPPPPHPSADPREPDSRSRPSRTPQRHRSPYSSRASSPNPADASHASPPPLLHPKPRSVAAAAAIGVPLAPIGTSGLAVGGVAVTGTGLPQGASASAPSITTSGGGGTHHHFLPHSHHALGHHLSRPSSSSSIHSSGSAIFERDIEFPAVASLSLNPNNTAVNPLTHKSSRIFHQTHGSTLEQTVPAVLDDAVEALTASGPTQEFEALEIEAPAPTVTSINMARQSSASIPHALRKSSAPSATAVSSASRSPSPAPSPTSVTSVLSPASGVAGERFSPLASPATSPGIISQLASQQHATSTSPVSGTAVSGSPSPTRSPTKPFARPPMAQRVSTGPQLPGGWAFEEKGEDGSGSSALATAPNPLPSHLTPTKEKRRISFISYNDLLLSVPTTVTSLGEIASGSLSPDHLPGTVSPGVQSRSPIVGPNPTVFGVAGASSVHGSIPADLTLPRSGLGYGEGEWQREGLGKGLEQRLEDLVTQDK